MVSFTNRVINFCQRQCSQTTMFLLMRDQTLHWFLPEGVIETNFLSWKRCCVPSDLSFSVSPWTKHCQLKAVGEDNFAHPRCVMHHIRLQSRSTFTLRHRKGCSLTPSMITMKHTQHPHWKVAFGLPAKFIQIFSHPTKQKCFKCFRKLIMVPPLYEVTEKVEN